MGIVGALLDIAGAVTKEAIANKQGDTIRELKAQCRMWIERATEWENLNAKLGGELDKCILARKAAEQKTADVTQALHKACRDRDIYHQQLIGKGFKPLPAEETDDVYPEYKEGE